MNIFETKSKYFENNNSWFATKFASMAITTVVILVALVILYMIINACVYNSYKVAFARDTEAYLTDYGFTYKDLKFMWVHPEDVESDNCTKRYLFKAKQLYHPDLNNGRSINVDETQGSLKIYIHASTYAGTKLKVENIGMVWDVMELAPGDTSYFFVTDSIHNWFMYLHNPKNNVFRNTFLSRYPLSETIERLKHERKIESKDTVSINDFGRYKTNQYQESKPVDTIYESEAINDFMKRLDNSTEKNSLNRSSDNLRLPPVTVVKKKWDI